jgi:hypothetical protein
MSITTRGRTKGKTCFLQTRKRIFFKNLFLFYLFVVVDLICLCFVFCLFPLSQYILFDCFSSYSFTIYSPVNNLKTRCYTYHNKSVFSILCLYYLHNLKGFNCTETLNFPECVVVTVKSISMSVTSFEFFSFSSFLTPIVNFFIPF